VGDQFPNVIDWNREHQGRPANLLADPFFGYTVLSAAILAALRTIPMNAIRPPDQPRPSVVIPWLVLCLSQFLSWVCVLMGPLSILFPVISIATLFYFIRRRCFLVTGLFILSSPLTIPFLSGAYDYSQGTAKLRDFGLPGTTFHNLDRELRCGYRSSGCLVWQNEWVTQTPYNFAVRSLTAVFGPIAGAYLGPYPTLAESEQALVTATPQSANDLKRDRLTIGEEVVYLDPGIGEVLCESIGHRFPSLDNSDPEIQATVWQQECIVLRITQENDTPGEPRAGAIVLFSRATGRPFAYYSQGKYSHHFPPVPWIRPSC
jgi:hypothetical protein